MIKTLATEKICLSLTTKSKFKTLHFWTKKGTTSGRKVLPVGSVTLWIGKGKEIAFFESIG